MGSAIAPRNFTITVEERIRAIVNGAPAYMRRKRQIEDFQQSIAEGLAVLARGETQQPETLRIRLQRALAKLNELIALHNRYYPSEANLRIDLTTGRLLENGAPWTPMELATFESLGGSEE